jgi:PcRGLX-like protein central beta sandwich domain
MMKMSGRFFCVIALAFFSMPTLQAGEVARLNLDGADFVAGKLKLPLIVTERCGVQRDGEVVSSGVPFPPGFLSDVKKLRVVDSDGQAVPSQAQLMIKWHKPVYDDSVQWALISFPAKVVAGATSTYYLLDDGKTVEGSAAGVLKVEAGETGHLINTGAATFTIPGQGPVLISEAAIGAEKVIGGAGLRLEITSGPWPERGLEKGAKLTAEVTKVVMEESGALRAVLALHGQFKPGDKDGKHYEFCSRLYFSSGSSEVRIITTIKNNRLRPKLIEGKRRAYVWPIEDASLLVDLVPGEGREVRTITEGNLLSQVASADMLTAYQDSSGGDKWKDLGGKNYARWLSKYTKGKEVRGVSFRGYRIKVGEKELSSGNAHDGVLALVGKKVSLSAALRNFRLEYPSAIGASKNTLRVAFFPGEFSEPFHLNSGQRKSWDLRLALGGQEQKKEDLQALGQRQDGLLLFRALPAWMVRCATSGAWPSGLALVDGGKSSLRRDKTKLDGINTGWDWHGWISSWNAGGGHWNQSTCFGSWVLWGNGAAFDTAESRALWAGDLCALHYDKPSLKSFWLMLRSWNWRENRLVGETYPGYYNRDTWGLPDSGHMCMMMWPEYYFLTGDMRAREAVEHLGTRARAFLWQYNYTDSKDGSSPTGRTIGWCKKLDPDADPKFTLYNRYIGWPLYNLSQYYRFSGDPLHLAEARTVARAFRNTGRYSPTGFLCCYINKKGSKAMYGGQGPFEKYRDKSASTCYAHFQMGIMTSGLVEYYRMSRDVEALDTMIGFSDFATHHAMLKEKDGTMKGWTYAFADYWGPYDLAVCGSKPPTFTVSNFRVIQPMGAIYGFSGRSDYLQVLKASLKTVPRTWLGIAATYMAVKHPKKDSQAPQAVKDLAAEALGEGKVKISWSVPAGEVAWYQLKRSTSPIVELVKGWPDRSEPQPTNQAEWEARVQAFQKKQLAFWQAFNVEGEPTPGKAAQPQEMVLEGLKPGRQYFAIKSWDAAENISQLSNVVSVEVK